MKYYSPEAVAELRGKALATDLVIYRSDTRNESFFVCKRMKEWLSRHGFELNTMLEHGIPAVELLDKSNNDLVALMATESALKRRAKGVTDIIAKGVK